MNVILIRLVCRSGQGLNPAWTPSIKGMRGEHDTTRADYFNVFGNAYRIWKLDIPARGIHNLDNKSEAIHR